MVVQITQSLKARGSQLASTGEQLRVLSNANGFPPFEQRMGAVGLDPLHATGITVFQINVGKLCNQTCAHCHVDAGPDRREVMTRETAEQCIRALARTDIPTVDSDFNQMLDLPLDHGLPRHIRDFDPTRLAARRIVTGNHCYGCTAGAGSAGAGTTT